MKHDKRFLLGLLGTLPLGCVVGTFDPNGNPTTVGGNASVGGATATVSGATNTGGKSGVIGSGTTGGNTLTTTGGSATVGGNSSSIPGATTGGATNAGGTIATGGLNSGGAFTSGGALASGGATIVGGANSSATGGAQTAGGNTATGGAVSTLGGAPGTGGAITVGGTLGTGGTSVAVTTGGTITTTGGVSAAGGTTATGGVITTGGAVATGGTTAATGGAPVTGGAPPVTGGAPATGGAATGGVATGGAATGGVPPTGGTSAYEALEIASGRNHTCALMADKTVFCWGNNCDGELGDGSQTVSCVAKTVEEFPKSTKPVQVVNISGASAVAAGHYHSCAVVSGRVLCWGYGGDGQLGNGKSGSYMSGTPVLVNGITNADLVVAGGRHTCALLSDGTVNCWGEGTYGRLGNGKTEMSAIPVTVVDSRGSPLVGVSALTAGESHTCAALSDGTGLCWGYNYYGQLGDGKTENSAYPVKTLFGPVVDIVGGVAHSCGRSRDDVIACWGANGSGQLGDGTTNGSLEPVKAQVSAAPLRMSLGDVHSCAVVDTSGPTVECWGYNQYGQLGDGTYDERDAPVPVKGLEKPFRVAAGYEHTCALVGSGTAYCWGYGGFGQLGDGTTGDSPVPSLVSGF